MQELVSLEDARRKVLRDARKLLANLRSLVSPRISTAAQAVRLLNKIRAAAYEDINQIQHEHMIVAAVEWLLKAGHAPRSTAWTWNPRQTGSGTQPDLEGRQGMKVCISAEITTSAKPVGTILKRMHSTLSKLARMEGRKFYFVPTDKMRRCAHGRVSRVGADIEAVLLDA